MTEPEFDGYAHTYQEMVREPIRDRFARNPQFFDERKWILLRDFFKARQRSTGSMSWLDVGAGQGNLLRMGRSSFGRVAGCDTSPAMLEGARDLEVRLQSPPERLPFGDQEFDLATAVCVFHHVEPVDRPALVQEMKRVLRPGGIICLIEHNAQNFVVRGMVKRIPLDVNAVLLKHRECHALFRGAGLRSLHTEFFLYLPELLYRHLAPLEALGKRVPFGGQYAAFAERPA